MKKTLRMISSGLVAAMLLATLSACGSSSSTTTTADSATESTSGEAASTASSSEAVEIRVAHGLTETDPVHIGFLKFQEVIEASGTNMTVKIFPNGQLSSSDRDLIEAVQLEEIDVSAVAASNLAPTISDFYVFNANYLFDSVEDARDTLLGEKGDYLIDRVADQNTGIKIAGYFGGTMQSIWTTNKAINTFDDFANIKIRSAGNAINIAEIEGLNATATPVDWGELYTGLQQGTVDSLFSNCVTAMSTFSDILTNGTYLGHNIYLPVVIASDSMYNSLSAEQQAAFDDAMEQACEAQWAAVIELNASINEQLVEMTESGELVYVFELSDEDKALVKESFISNTEEMVAEMCDAELLEYFRS